MKVKVGEYYRHKWNKYILKVTKVSLHTVELKTVYSGVFESVKIENFDMNYEPAITIYQWRKTIKELFSFGEIQLFGDCVRVKVDDTIIDFSINADKMLTVCFTDDVKEAVDADINILRFLIEDADDVIQSFADLFE